MTSWQECMHSWTFPAKTDPQLLAGMQETRLEVRGGQHSCKAILGRLLTATLAAGQVRHGMLHAAPPSAALPAGQRGPTTSVGKALHFQGLTLSDLHDC